METLKKQGTTALIAGGLVALMTLLQFVNFIRNIRWGFSFATFLGVPVLAFVAVMLFLKRRDKMLLVALSVLAVYYLIWNGIVNFVAVVIVLLIALVMTTEYLPQAKALAEKIWYAPAILTFIGCVIGLFNTLRYGYFTFFGILWLLAETAAMLLVGFWLVFPERDIAELFSSAKSKVDSAMAGGSSTVAEAEVDGYCDLFKQVLLMTITFGIWYLIWIYRMTRYLNRVGGVERRTPVNQLLLCIFVPFYLVYWTYQSALRTDKLAAAVGVESKLSTLSLILATLVPVVAPVLIQDKINAVIAVENGSRRADFDPAEKSVAELKVNPASVDGYCGLFKHLLLLLLTFGIWNFVWIYRMTRYLNRVEGEPERKPVSKLLLCIFVPFYMLYWIYKSSQLIDKLGAQTGVRSNLAAPCLVLSLVAGIVPHILMQDKINEIIVKENSVEVEAA